MRISSPVSPVVGLSRGRRSEFAWYWPTPPNLRKVVIQQSGSSYPLKRASSGVSLMHNASFMTMELVMKEALCITDYSSFNAWKLPWVFGQQVSVLELPNLWL